MTIPTLDDATQARPRERLLRHGARVLTDAELLAIVLRTGVKGRPVLTLARDLIVTFGSLRSLFAATPQALSGVPGLGAAKTSLLLSILELARRTMLEDLAQRCALDHPGRVKQYCIALVGHRDVEHCMALYLDNRLRLITAAEVSRGTLAQAPVYPREVVRAALRHHAAALILTHNHPSGTAEPSEADTQLTRHLQRALALVDVRLVDHLIVANGQAVSLAERGLL